MVLTLELFSAGHTQAIDGCYTSTDCSGAPVTDSDITDARTCCIAETPMTMSYRASGGGACMPCQGTHTHIMYTVGCIVFKSLTCV